MTDEERIARLTELARRAWPGLEMKIEHGDRVTTVWSMSCDYPDEMVLHVTMREHSRALDALEAALSVLAGKPPEPPWVEKLVSEWEREAATEGNKVRRAADDFARELREHAKEGV